VRAAQPPALSQEPVTSTITAGSLSCQRQLQPRTIGLSNTRKF